MDDKKCIISIKGEIYFSEAVMFDFMNESANKLLKVFIYMLENKTSCDYFFTPVSEISEVLGIGSYSIRKYIQTLIKIKFIERVSLGTYKIIKKDLIKYVKIKK